jgi:hypothetical protein
MMAEVTRAQVGRWPRGEPFELWPHMQAITQEVIMRSVFGRRRRPPRAAARAAARADRGAERPAD